MFLLTKAVSGNVSCDDFAWFNKVLWLIIIALFVQIVNLFTL